MGKSARLWLFRLNGYSPHEMWCVIHAHKSSHYSLFMDWWKTCVFLHFHNLTPQLFLSFYFLFFPYFLWRGSIFFKKPWVKEEFLAFIDLPISFHQTPNLGFWPKLTIQTNLFCYPSLESSKSLSGTHQQILLKYFCLKWCLIFPLFMQNMPVVKW